MNSFIEFLVTYTPCIFGHDVGMKQILAGVALTLAGAWLMIWFYAIVFRAVSSIFNGLSKSKFYQKCINPIVSKIGTTYIFMALFTFYLWFSFGSALLTIAAIFLPGPVIYWGISYLYKRFSKKKTTETHELHYT